MARGRPRKYRTKKLSKAAKAQNTKLFAMPDVAVDCSWYERQKLKRLPQSLGPLESLQRTVMESMRKSWNSEAAPHVGYAMSCLLIDRRMTHSIRPDIEQIVTNTHRGVEENIVVLCQRHGGTYQRHGIGNKNLPSQKHPLGLRPLLWGAVKARPWESSNA